MISDTDRAALADLSMRALDAIAEFDEDAELLCACMVFEIRAPDHDEPETGPLYHGGYKSLPGNSPRHVAGLLSSTAARILR